MTVNPSSSVEAFVQDTWVSCQWLAQRRGISNVVLVRVNAVSGPQDVWVPVDRVRARTQA
jgi:hypothetical protein